MGSLLVVQGDERYEIELVASTLLGRHWNCDIVVEDRHVPNFWLELRWLGKMWGWRGLTAVDRLRGTGRVMDGGWRELSQGGRVRCGHILEIELVDVDPPVLSLRDLVSGELVSDNEIGDFIDWRDEGAFTLADEEEEAHRLRDGEVLTARGGVFEVRLPLSDARTEMALFHLEHPTVRLEVNLDNQTAAFCAGDNRVSIEGATGLVLCVFALARLEADESGGWLTLDEAFERWLHAGGSKSSEARRISWEKGKIRTRLSQANVAGGSDLFENQRRGGTASSRLLFDRERIINLADH